MPISIEEVLKISHLARLELSEEEAKVYSYELSKILDYFKTLQEVDTTNIEPTFHSVKLKTPFREDEVKEFENKEDLIKNAPEVYGTSIVVPKVIRTTS